MSNSSLKKKIIDDLKKTGFPTEVKISILLDKAGWTTQDTLFEDPDEGKSREIDINAVNVDYSHADVVKIKVKEGDENKLISHLIIEIKKSDNQHWVFFDNGGVNWPWITPRNFKSAREDFHHNLIDDFKRLGLKTHRYEKAILHKSHHVYSSSPSQPSKIYEALTKTSKALRYFIDRYGVGGCSLHIFIPMIIFDGNLWSASLSKKNEIKLKKVESLLVVYSELMEYKKLRKKFEERQIIDIVTAKGFEKRFKIIQRDNKEIYKSWTAYLRKQEAKKQKKKKD